MLGSDIVDIFKKSLTFLDLFSGIGGFRLGMEQAGHRCVGHCEIDKFAQQSYEAIHRPKEEEFNFRDITTVRSGDLPYADIWCFGFPCQDISIAGRQRGLEGARSGLFYTVIELLQGKEENDKPKILLIENVKNLLSIDGGKGFTSVLSALDEAGYDCEWEVLNSKDFGVSQNRERIFIIGHLRGTSGRKVFPFGRTNSKTLKQVIGGGQGNRIYDPEGLSCTLSSQGGGQGAKTGLYFMTKSEDILKIRELATCLDANYHKGLDCHQARTGVLVKPVLTPDRLEKRQNGRRFKEDGEPMFTLTGQDRHGVMIYQRPRGNNKGGLDTVAPTVSSHSYQDNNHLFDGVRIRRLTPLECFRLQGFPDGAFKLAKEAGVSDSQLYKQAGNAVTVPVIYEIAKRLEIAE